METKFMVEWGAEPWPQRGSEREVVPGREGEQPQIQARGQGSCHGAYVIREVVIRALPPPRALEFLKGSKVNLPLAPTGEVARPEGVEAGVLSILPTGPQSQPPQNHRRGQELGQGSLRLQGRRSLRPGFLPARPSHVPGWSSGFSLSPDLPARGDSSWGRDSLSSDKVLLKAATAQPWPTGKTGPPNHTRPLRALGSSVRKAGTVRPKS